jgi:hypothetical protein
LVIFGPRQRKKKLKKIHGKPYMSSKERSHTRENLYRGFKKIWIMIALLHPDPHPSEYLQHILYRGSLVREFESSFSLVACNLDGIAEIV